jgi:hypothetical protein
MNNTQDLISSLPVDETENVNENQKIMLSNILGDNNVGNSFLNLENIDYREYILISILLILFSLQSVDNIILSILPEKLRTMYFVSAIKITLFLIIYTVVMKVYLSPNS